MRGEDLGRSKVGLDFRLNNVPLCDCEAVSRRGFLSQFFNLAFTL